MKKLVIFDLDGTLMNSVADLAQATNYALTQLGFPIHPTDAYYQFAGNGVRIMMERALPEDARGDEHIENMLSHFLPYYKQNIAVYTMPYPGIMELLTALKAHGIKVAVASNKFQSGTQEVIDTYFPELEIDCVLGQREGIAIKPDPQIVYDIMKELDITSKKEVIYVGDSNVDMQTAINAEVDSIGVTWGFRTKEELEAFHPTLIVDTADAIRHYVLNVHTKQ